MGTGAAGVLSSASVYVDWEEVYVSTDKGRREVHYYLKRKDGTSDLAVLGKEKSPRHITYRYAVHNRLLVGASSPSLLLVKLRSRGEVIDWLNSVVSESHAAVSIHNSFGSFDERDAGVLNFGGNVKMQKGTDHAEQFLWLGSSWTCKKMLKHYQSFCRRGVKISVNDFVFVLAEENKRLVAYLEDMYEDLNGSKMVVVRWFHRIDEVDIDLPHNFSDREIFFSSCPQDLHIECIDGLATVLSPQHYDKYINEVRQAQVQPFVCHRQYCDSGIEPFDITHVKGYWRQDALRCMYSAYNQKASGHQSDPRGHRSCPVMGRPRKRLRLLRNSTANVQCPSRKDAADARCLDDEIDVKNASCRQEGMVNCALGEKQPSSLAVGCSIEVLSQDSGIRGCWFRASVIKKSKDKVKVRYHDIKDADNEENNLEEWVSSTRIAVNDSLGLRLNGRNTIRPTPQPYSGKVTWAFAVGALVDAWWYDGWWEGIVVRRESNDRVLVHFPGEKGEAVFGSGELRHSQEWLGNSWKDLHARADVAARLLNGIKVSHGACKSYNVVEEAQTSISLQSDEGCASILQSCRGDKGTDLLSRLKDLSKDKFAAQLHWKSTRKRSRTGHAIKRLQRIADKGATKPQKTDARRRDQCFQTSAQVKPLKVDKENCKFVGDCLFNTSVVPPVRSLVMSS